MSEMEPARRARVSAYVEADDLSALSELAPDLARPAYSIQPLPPQFGTGAGALQRVAAAAAGAGAGVSAGGSRDFLPWWHGEYGQVAGASQQQQQQQQASSTGVDGTPSVVVQNPHIWFPYETTGTTRMNNDSGLPGSSQLPSASAPWTAGTDVMNTFAAAQQQPPTNGIGHGQQQHQHPHQAGGVTANSNVPTSTHFASADPMSSLPGGLSYYGSQLGTHNNNGSGVHVPPAAQGGVFPPTHHQQQQQQQGFSMSHAQLHAAQTQMAFENSFGDARGIAGMGGPNPTLDDLAWTDYFASFLASLSSENPAGSNGSNQHTGS
ncbi:unnamed protein product [Tilletia controversa]|nr:unnamed protein product [Tilletia controversa]